MGTEDKKGYLSLKTNGDKAKHTPGPWHAYPHPTEDMITISTSKNREEEEKAEEVFGDTTICGVWTINEVQEANARLIAAAPETAAERDRLKETNVELLNALEHCQLWHNSSKWRYNKEPDKRDSWETQDCVIKAAIIKAKRGGS